MASSWKPWETHTPQWRAKAIAEGLTKQRWNAYGKLSPATRKTTNPREYAKGETVRKQRLSRQRGEILETLLKLTKSEGNDRARRRMRAHVNRMPDELVVKYHKVKPETHRRWASDSSKVVQVDGQPYNPSWYR